MHILLIDANLESGAWLKRQLAGFGFLVQHSRALDGAALNSPATSAAIILDLGASDQNAATVTQALRNAGLAQPLLLLAAGGTWIERVECLDAGADDYVSKPARVEEIAARLRAIIRRMAGSARAVIETGSIALDLKARHAWLNGIPLELTRNEFRLLRMFMLRPDTLLSHQDIQELLYLDGKARSANAVEVHITRLRRKIGRDQIRTARGIGYRMVVQPKASPEAATETPANIPLTPETWSPVI